MIKVQTKQLTAGMVTAKPILTKRGQEIAPTGTELTSQLIARLSFYKVTAVTVTKESYNKNLVDLNETVPIELEVPSEEPKAAEEPVVEEPKEDTVIQRDERSSYTQKLKATPSFQAFQTSYSQNIVNLMNNFQAIIDGNYSDSIGENLLKEASDMFASKTSLEIFDMVHNVRAVDDSVYAHSLNVALISRAIGKWKHMSKEDLDILTLAGLLHDIGKTQIPDEILNKQEKLTDEEFDLIRNHTKQGYAILKKTSIDTRVKLAALQHHERFDASGYPRGLEGDEIDDFASIVAIADVYDAMTAARAYRAPLCSFQVIAAFEEDGFQKYNPNMIYTFLKRVANCYANSRVLLSNGVSGRVVFLNERNLSRPIIKTDNNEMIDLTQAENRELFIKSIL